MILSPFIIRLADVNILLRPRFSYLQTYCRDYICTGEPELEIEATMEDIALERARSEKEDILEGIPVRHFKDEYLETLAVYRKIARELLKYNVMLFHGSCVAVDGVAYLFTAKSGTGKSTHVGLWRQMFGQRAVMVNDDKPLLRLTEQGVVAYGTPWDGKHRLSTNIGLPLKAVCILERSPDNHISPISVREAYPLLLQQTNRPKDPVALAQTLQLFDRIFAQVAVYRLGCNMDPEAAAVSYTGMNGGNTL